MRPQLDAETINEVTYGRATRGVWPLGTERVEGTLPPALLAVAPRFETLKQDFTVLSAKAEAGIDDEEASSALYASMNAQIREARGVDATRSQGVAPFMGKAFKR
jgi:hypothetical protein